MTAETVGPLSVITTADYTAQYNPRYLDWSIRDSANRLVGLVARGDHNTGLTRQNKELFRIRDRYDRAYRTLDCAATQCVAQSSARYKGTDWSLGSGFPGRRHAPIKPLVETRISGLRRVGVAQ